MNDNLILQENLFEIYYDNDNHNDLIILLFLLKKYKNICFQYFFDSIISYSIYIIECKDNFNIYIATKNDDDTLSEIDKFINIVKKI